MERETAVSAGSFLAGVFLLGGVILALQAGVVPWLHSPGGEVRDHGLACVDSDPSGYTNVTYVPFESLDEREQELLKPALEEGHVALTAEQAHAVDHTFIEYQNQTYQCGGGIP